MRLVKPLIVVAVMLAVLVVGQPTASAHKDCNYDGRDRACVSSNHEGASVCDNERDGKLVSGWFQLDNGESVFLSDEDGANGSCVVLQFSPWAVESFAVCETGHNCDFEYP